MLDTEHIWCNAVVELRIQAESRKQPLLLVHYDGWSRKYDEYLFAGSKRLAPLGLYTSRNDIPRYRMCYHNSQMNQAHVLEDARAQPAVVPADDDASIENGSAEI